jgi:spermidine/putrescine-binding protein
MATQCKGAKMRKLPILILLLLLAGGCTQATRPAPAPTPQLPQQDPLTIYGWSGYMPQDILDKYTAEYGVPIRYIIYSDQRKL